MRCVRAVLYLNLSVAMETVMLKHVLVLTNPDVNLKRMHQLYNDMLYIHVEHHHICSLKWLEVELSYFYLKLVSRRNNVKRS